MENNIKEARENETRGKKRSDRERYKKADRSLVTPNAFRGKHKDLQGWTYTYDTAARAYQYNKTTEAIAEWVKLNLRFPMDVWRILTTLKEPDQEQWKPTAPADPDDMVEKSIFAEDVKKYIKRKSLLEDNCCNVFTVVYGQCSDSLQAKLRAGDSWNMIYEKHDLVKLMKCIKVWMLNQEGSRSPVATADAALAALYKVRQNRHETLTDYQRRFTAATEVLEHIDVRLEKALAGLTNNSLKVVNNKKRDEATEAEISKAEKSVFEKFMAHRFIASADKARFSNVTVYLENEYVAGSDKFPKDVTAAYNFLENWKRAAVHVDVPTNDGVSFAQAGASADKAKTPKDLSHIQCHGCGKFGHKKYEGKCAPEEKEKWQAKKAATKTATANHMTGTAANSSDESDGDEYRVMLCTTHAAGEEEGENAGQVFDADGTVVESVMTHSFNTTCAYVIPPGSVGLDSMSSVDVFGESRLLTNIRKVRNNMHIACNAGVVVVTQMGDLSGYGPVWYHAEAIANILSLSNVQKKYPIRYNSAIGDFFTMQHSDGSTRVFRPTKKGLYASQLVTKEGAVNDGASLVTTVAGNAKSYTKREVKRAEQARRLMAIIGRPNEKQMREIVGTGQLPNCAVSEHDVRNALSIFGPDIGSLKGKTTRRKEPHVDLAMRPIPEEIMRRHREVVICFDIMHVNRIPFTVSISRALKFGTAEAVENRKAQTLLNSIKVIKATYARRGFLANRIAADNEFAPLEAPLSAIGMALNTVSRDEHVPEVERHIRTLKERCRATFNTLPFTRVPNRMLIELVYAMNFWLHAFPAQDGVSNTISPRELVTGTGIDAKKHCVIPFGAYVQTHEEHDNTLATRTVGAIALRPTGNKQGGHYFFSLMTGKRIVRNNWTEVPMPADVITRIEKMAGSKAMNRLEFTNRRNEEEDTAEDGDVISVNSDSDEPESEASGSDDDSEDARHNDDARSVQDGIDNDGFAHGDEPEPHPNIKPEPSDAPWVKEEPTKFPDDLSDGANGAQETTSTATPGEQHDDPGSNDSPAEMNESSEERFSEHEDDPAAHHGTNPQDSKWLPSVHSDTGSTPAVAPTGLRPGGDEYEKERPNDRETERNSNHNATGNGASNTAGQPTGVRKGEAPIATQRSKPNRSAGVRGSAGRMDRAKRGRRRNIRPIEEEPGETIDEKMDSRYGTRTREGLRTRKKAGYDVESLQAMEALQAMHNGIIHKAHMMAQTNSATIAPEYVVIHLAELNSNAEPFIHALLTQYGMKKGLKLFGKQGDAAVCAEMQQLHDLGVMTPAPPSTLSKDDRSAALLYLMFLKKKRDGEVRGRGCADGRKQRASAKKSEVSSPTITTEAVFIILVIAAKEGRDVMAMDIPGAFLQTNLKGERVHVKFEGRMAELLALIDPKLYRPNIVLENGRPVLYGELQRALYGMLQSALRFWEQVLDDLAALDFVVNPYDWCVANREVNGSQQTVGWHVDDFLVTHVDPKVNDQFYDWFDTKYGKRSPVKVHRGPAHDYLGMHIQLMAGRKVRISMTNYIEELLDDSPAEFCGTAPTPAARYLFDTCENGGKLDERRARIFHHLVAKALFLAKRARPDIQLAVAFLCTRVRESDEHDWKKLHRLLQSLRGSRELSLTLEADDSHIVKWWVDAAFAVAKDMRSQSGAIMSLGKGALYSSSTRQRINTRSSTEAELVAADDFMPQVLWTRYFLQEQGYEVRDNKLYQDNQSAILMETNGKGSSGKRTRHLNVRYFFISDRVASGEVSIGYCPTKEMMGDFLTKPLQGADFRRFRDAILNTGA